MALRFKLLQQAGEHSFYFEKLGFGYAVFSGVDHVQVMNKQKKILKLAGGAHRHMQELTKFGAPSAAATLRNIGRDRAGCAPNLSAQPKALFYRKQARNFVNKQDKLVTTPPNLKLPKVLHGRFAPLYPLDNKIASDYLKLNTNHLILTPYEVLHAN
jgi:hypothetical protein